MPNFGLSDTPPQREGIVRLMVGAKYSEEPEILTFKSFRGSSFQKLLVNGRKTVLILQPSVKAC